MSDNHTPEQRKLNMSHIRNKDTKPEEIVRKYLFTHGFRYRKNVSGLPGKPDIVLKKYNTVIFVHGCFWHMHDCGRFKWPTSNVDYWKPKLKRNVERDILNKNKLEDMGWNVLTIWECELKNNSIENTMEGVSNFLRSLL